ncbi:MAG: virulence RhuM family protein [Nitrospinae bacterium]|nr:virulence RhuM family protein [Nitrospinota bacterium]
MSKGLPAPPDGQFLVYQAEDGKLKIDVRFQGETVWLTQQNMAELFRTTQQNISQHIQSVYADGELAPGATHKKYLLVRQEGNRKVERALDSYNLDMVISVGYRVKREYDQFKILTTADARPVDADFERAVGSMPKLPRLKKTKKKPSHERI